jgi:hypothetical protein
LPKKHLVIQRVRLGEHASVFSSALPSSPGLHGQRWLFYAWLPAYQGRPSCVSENDKDIQKDYQENIKKHPGSVPLAFSPQAGYALA